MSSGDLVVRLLTPGDRERWDAFVRVCPDATFFHLSAWAELLEEQLGHRAWYFYAERGGDIVAVLPLAQVRSLLFGHALVSLPFCAYGGIAGDAAAAPLLEARADELAAELGVEYLELRNLSLRHEDWPRQTLYATFRKEILPDDEANLNAIPRKQRAMVRKGIKHGLCAEIDEDVTRFFRLYSDNVRRHGTPALPRRFFAALRERFGDDCEILTVTAPDGRPLSSVLSFYFRDEVLPYYAGDHVDARRVAANDFKYWALMTHARARGCTVFDYGRSKAGTGPWSFKKNWGFEPHTLSYEYRLYKREAVPQNNPLNPKYAAFIAIWKRLPLPVANLLGPPIARHLG
ncbi:MAG: FemAB family XrtA/PEP-CTERM system-associated protein [Gammaproteobacteria bacterium]